MDVPLKRTYAYRLVHDVGKKLDSIIEESRQHLIRKFGRNGYANDKVYFEDEEYNVYLDGIGKLTEDKDEFTIQFIKVNKIVDYKILFDAVKSKYPNWSLKELIQYIYDIVKGYIADPYFMVQNKILQENGIDESELIDKTLVKN